MGKKSKVGKQRKDKYYQLAKESGYRSRAAFKLVQLNRKFEFLQRCQVLVDLCAAPGGWCQAASQYMPMSSLIIGVDLVPIKPIPNVITFQDDITADSCKKTIKRELKTWSADCVLHDGAPNVGQSWVQDAFAQAQLTLSALKLATSILKKGGWFVTKVFRSKDYASLITVFQKLFQKVHVTKPQASRNESAEIFVVCQNYLKPDAKLVADSTDMKLVFKEATETPSKTKLSALYSDRKKPKAEGYDNEQVYPKLSVRDFLLSHNHLDLLAKSAEIALDDERIVSHASTTKEIRACLEDVQVLGKKELRDVLTWHKKMRQYLLTLEKGDKPVPVKNADEQENEVPVEEPPVLTEEEQTKQIEEVVKQAELKILKKVKRKELKAKRKYRDRVQMNMIIPGDEPDYGDNEDLFNLQSLRKKAETEKRTLVCEDEELSAAVSSVSDMHDSEVVNDVSPLIVDLDPSSPAVKAKMLADAWFKKDAFADIDTEADLLEMDDDSKAKLESDGVSVEDEDDEYDMNAVIGDDGTPLVPDEVGAASTSGMNNDNDETSDDEDGMEIVKTDASAKKIRLDPEALAMGEKLIYSSKTRRELMEWGFNRYTFNDDNLPDWFMDDEKKHSRKQLPVTKEQVEYYRQRAKEINARPIKKVVEAKARKRKRAIRKLEKVRKKADAILEQEEKTDKEKSYEVNKIYKQANLTKKKPEVSYVVAKKHLASKRPRRPAGVSGRYKMVDHRMKKDLRKEKAAMKRAKGKKKK